MEKKVIKSGFWYIIGDLLVKCMAFISTPIFARMLTKSEYGSVTNYLAWYTILITITSMNLHSTINRARYDMEKEFDSYIASVLVLGSTNTLLIFVIATVAKSQVVELLAMDWKYVVIMFLVLMVSPAINFFQVCQRFKYNYKLSTAVSLTISISGVILSLVLIFNWSDREIARIIGAHFPIFLAGIIIYLIYICRGRKIRFSFWKYALKICLPYIPHLLALNLLSSMDRVMIKKICGPENAAMYNMAYSCALIIMILLNAMNTAVSPWLGEKLHDEKYDEIHRITKPYVMLFIVPAIAFMLVVPEVLYIMGGKAYIDAKYTLAPLVMSCICQFLYCMYVNIEQYEKKTVGMAFASVFSVIVNGVLNFALIPRFGYIAAAYTTLASYLVLLLLHVFLVKQMGLLKVYNNRFIMKMVLVALGVTITMVYLYQMHFIVRYGILLLVVICGGVFVIKHKKYILDFAKKKQN